MPSFGLNLNVLAFGSLLGSNVRELTALSFLDLNEWICIVSIQINSLYGEELPMKLIQ